MKKLLLILFVFISSETLAQEITTFILVRHAEKMNDGTRNPPLSQEGVLRSARLMEHLEETEITQIYSTEFFRTMKTVSPIAQERGLEIKNYGWNDPQGFLQKLFELHNGGTILISGHSNTTPMLANLLLGEEKLKQFDEKDYGNILVVSATKLGNGKLFHLRF